MVFPFIVCKTQGGPYEDEAFVAGVYFGKLLAAYETGTPSLRTIEPVTVPTPLLPQIDLLAMQWQCSITLERHEDTPEWTTVYLSEAGDD